MGKKDFICGSCKRAFVSEDAARQHIIDGHKNSKTGIYQLIGFQQGRDYDDEPSMADRAVNASLDRAMGVFTDDEWLLP